MTDERMQTPEFTASLLRGMTSRRMSRRNMMKYAGAGVGALSFSSILAACGGGDTTSATGGPTIDWGAEPGPEVNFSNWPLYIDKAKDKEGEKYYPSLRLFEEETGIKVNYDDEINDNAAFFGELLPQLQAGQDTGRDIIVITNGREFSALVKNGWVTELDPSRRPNFDANAASWAKDPAFDPGNKYSMAWQSGLTGIGFDTTKINGTITKADDLMNPDIVGTNSVGVLKADVPDFAMINLGIDPTTSGPDEWREAAEWLTMLRDSGTVRQWYDQGYIDDLLAGNLSATLAWSGDVLYYAIWEGYSFDFIVPEGGALLWIDNMMIPANSSNPQGASQVMDYVYKPDIAQLITEWVLYMSPVPAVQDLIAAHASEESGGYAEKLELTATSPFLWPDDAMLQRVSLGRQLDTQEDTDEWDSIFPPIFEG